MTLVGTKVRNFRIEKELGRGGMGDVYVAYDETLERRVALKSIRADSRLSPEAKARFLREARTLSRLDHPGICRIHDYIDGDTVDFLVLELVEGQTLQRVGRNRSEAEKLQIALRLAEVLAVAHGEGIIHRDLKPDNVMATSDGGIKVLDFGLARSVDAASAESTTKPAAESALDAEGIATVASDRTALGRVIGTPYYMSPEQAAGQPVTPASDMYSLGLTLQTLFTGRMAYDKSRNVAELLENVKRGRTRPVGRVDRDLGVLIERLKSLAPARRPTAVETAERLRWIRDKPRRRLRRLVALAVLALIAAAGLKYTVDLRRERAEADRRRAQAEDLIGFMLGDLREKLEPVGRLDVLDAVGDKALAYFASLRDVDLTGDERFRLSKAMSQIGEVRMAQGDLTAAAEAFEESLAIAEALVARSPDRTEWKVGLGAAYFWIGSVDYARNDLLAARRCFLQYLEVSQELVALDPANEEWQLELGYAYTNLAAVDLARGDTEAAIGFLRGSVEIKQRLVDRAPENTEWQEGLANSLHWLAQTLSDRGDLNDALETSTAVLEIRRLLERRDPQNMDAKFALSVIESGIGALLQRMGRNAEARRHYRADLDIARLLAARDPENATWRRALGVSESNLGLLLLKLDETGAAEELLRAARNTAEQAAALDSPTPERRRDLASAHYAVARLELAKQDPGAALRESAAALEILRPLARDAPDDSSVVVLLADTLSVRGTALRGLGRDADARTAWQEALAATADATAGGSGELLARRARALLLLGRTAEAREELRTLSASGYAETELVELARERGIDFAASGPRTLR